MTKSSTNGEETVRVLGKICGHIASIDCHLQAGTCPSGIGKKGMKGKEERKEG